MSISNCPTCGIWIDEDYDVEHYEQCKEDNKETKQPDVIMDNPMEQIDGLIKQAKDLKE